MEHLKGNLFRPLFFFFKAIMLFAFPPFYLYGPDVSAKVSAAVNHCQPQTKHARTNWQTLVAKLCLDKKKQKRVRLPQHFARTHLKIDKRTDTHTQKHK